MPTLVGEHAVHCGGTGMFHVQASQGWQRRRQPSVNSLFDRSSWLWLVFQILKKWYKELTLGQNFTKFQLNIFWIIFLLVRKWY
jgi:hypothetical protein